MSYKPKHKAKRSDEKANWKETLSLILAGIATLVQILQWFGITPKR